MFAQAIQSFIWVQTLMVQNKTAAAANLRECGTGYLMSLFGAAAALLA
jgi:hypothetical protein